MGAERRIGGTGTVASPGVDLPEPSPRRTGPGSKPRVDLEKRREEYIRVASVVFLQRGLNVATMQDVADAAGARKVLFYRVFKSKQALLEAILERVIEAIHAAYAQKTYVYGMRALQLAHAAKDCPEIFLLVLRYSRAGVEQGDWGKRVADTIAGYTRERWFEPSPDAPPGAEDRAEQASRLNVPSVIDTVIAWIENRDGLDDETRLRWWGRISREYHLGSREAYRLGPAKAVIPLPGDSDAPSN